jgi:hypothetical protein
VELRSEGAVNGRGVEGGVVTAREPVSDRHSDALEEARDVIELAESRGVTTRLIGGVAFRAQLPHWTYRHRPAHDIDFVVRAKEAATLARLLEERGYLSDRRQNALYGHKQLYFVDEANQRPVDVIIDRLEMCHTLELKDRLDADPLTVGRAELLLSKLQIVKLNRKDALDVVAMLTTYEVGDDRGISTTVISEVIGRDWGWWRTVTGNLEVIARTLEEDDGTFAADLAMEEPGRWDPAMQVAALRRFAEETPKTRTWKLRSRIGERAVWYEEPEENIH